ncbi:adhesion molecule with Ig-like domain 3 [Plakobranchus ocellatus]|uniref:Adhesion molecule with Ig-like domain 3 n=1 Tax=Plakobranchus ocellatus TaxID=259542 RepID=A0AAV4DWS3_9GAST|nr:adhesion molecule with Ig-like domain 3 [Plakobranchus ocellatus]
MGDFNAKVGDERQEDVVGPNGIGTVNERGRSGSTEDCPLCRCISTSSTVNCENLGLLEIPTEKSTLEKAIVLNLNYNQIREIRSGAFADMKFLLELKLIGNGIRTIEIGAFKESDLPQLEYLSLESNELESIESETFSNMPRLYLINLSGNRITHISQDAFKGLTKLSKVHLYHNSLTSVAWVIG